MTSDRDLSTDLCFRPDTAGAKIPASAPLRRRSILPALRILRRSALLFVVAAAVSCGLADDERDEKNKYEYITFSDAAFREYCLEHFDLDDDGRISLYEAHRVVDIDCADLGIRSLYDIGYFIHLRRLDCRDNAIGELDVSMLPRLEWLDCSHNRLVRLRVGQLRALTALYCSENALAALDLGETASLSTFDGRANGYPVLDLHRCGASLRAVVTDNPSLGTVYCLPSQSVDADGHTDLVWD